MSIIDSLTQALTWIGKRIVIIVVIIRCGFIIKR
jgi:hypothetical protein